MIDTVDLSAADPGPALDRALRRLGFVQLVGHGVDDAIATDLWAAMDAYFDQPLEVKLADVVDDPLANRGYRSRGSESLVYSLGGEAPPDLFESFNVGHDERAGTHPLCAATPWPSALPELRRAASAYLAQMAELAARLDDTIGRLLGMPALADHSRRGPDTMACIRYRRAPDELDAPPGQARMGPHSDYTTFTVLRADPVPGLEILGPDGWLPVLPEPGALLLNVGDLLAIWTNDTWRSTLHRVPVHGDERDAPLRRSAAYFHYPDPLVVVAPLPEFVDGGGARYEAVRVADHLAAKLAGPKTARASGGASTLAERTYEE
ncbi:MAG: isopenicillin N synthase family oxygenase [Acidimicrobiales bacterium]|nr:isopenicillin N synthase family oxygenase [Acidimicrobiales bacterium]